MKEKLTIEKKRLKINGKAWRLLKER